MFSSCDDVAQLDYGQPKLSKNEIKIDYIWTRDEHAGSIKQASKKPDLDGSAFGQFAEIGIAKCETKTIEMEHFSIWKSLCQLNS